jgi:beta-glucosidase-like glycosyl hydrolase
MIKAGVGSVMMAHLSIPALDTTTNLPTSLSAIAVQNLLRKELGYNGITFTDALEMKGVSKFFPKGEASVMSLIAGNDMLCLPGDIAGSIEKVKEAIAAGKLSWEDLNERVKKVLRAKYNLGLASLQPIDTTNLAADLNASTNTLKEILAKKALTLLKLENKTERGCRISLRPCVPKFFMQRSTGYLVVGMSQNISCICWTGVSFI